MEQNAVHELTAAYALDALDAEEERAYERHLRRCDRCREELRSLQEAASMLAYAAEPVSPPPALRERIVQQARSEGSKVVRLRPRWAYPAAAVAAVAAVAALGLGVWNASLASSLERERERSAYLDPGARLVDVQGAEGRLVVSSSGKAALILADLPPAGNDKTYELWVVEPGAKPKPAGLFGGGQDRAVIEVKRPVPAGAQVVVTREVAGGVDTPQGPKILSAQA